MAQQQNPGIWHWSVVWVTLAFSALLYGQLFFFHGFDEASTRQAIRWSARLSVLLFCMAFSASAVHSFWKNSATFWLCMNRRHLGISFAASHLVHLGFLALLQQQFHPVFERAKTISLLGGGLAYLFVVLMLLTSFPFFADKISRQNWKLLHTAGSWWIWFIFLQSYLKRALTEVEYIPLAALLVAVLVLRLSAKWAARDARPDSVRRS